MANVEYGLQMYCLRDITGKDLKGALRQVARMGYKYIEFAGFFGHPAEDVKAWLDEYGLICSGTHTGWQEVAENFEETVKFHKNIGNKNIIVPGCDLSTQEKIDEFVAMANEFQPKLAAEGINFGYHNHAHEFRPNEDGSMIHDQLVYRTNLDLEIDTFWAYVGMQHPVQLMERLKDRLKVIHIKDGFADGKGNVVIPLEYAAASNFSEGYAAVFFPEGDWGYIDVNGNTLARGFTRAYDFLNGYGEVWTSGTNRYDNITAWIDANGAFVPFMDDRFYPITHDRMWMDAEVGSVSPNHLVDGEGNILSAEPVWLSDVGPAEFAGGLQPVMNTERKWGYMDLDGRIVIPFSYDYAWDFDGELAYVGLGEWTGYIDQAGNAVYMWEDPIK